MKKKYILVQIGIRSSDYEATQTDVFEININASMDKFAEQQAEDFLPNYTSKNEDGEYEFGDGEAVSFVDKVVEISEEEYIILKKYL